MDQQTEKLKDKDKRKPGQIQAQAITRSDFDFVRNMRALRSSLIPALSEDGSIHGSIHASKNGIGEKLTDTSDTIYPVRVKPPIKLRSGSLPNESSISSDSSRKPKPLLRSKTDGFIKVQFTPIEEEALINPIEREENIKEALVTLFFTKFTLIFSILAGLWHLYDGLWCEGVTTIAILVLGGVIVQLAFLFNSEMDKKKMWKKDKCLIMFSCIPCTLSTILSLKNLYFSSKESKSQLYSRPWSKTQVIFLVESLAIGFVQSIYQLCYLMDVRDDLFIVKGIFLGTGILILPAYMAFARMKFDSQNKPDRFGNTEIEKFIRGIVIYSYKAIWVISYACLITTFHIMFADTTDKLSSAVMACFLLFVCLELPVFTFSLRTCMKFSKLCQGIFFFFPQFVSLFIFLLWLNYDLTVYDTFIGVSVLGSFFWAELILMTGWLLDSCTGTELDFNSTYPHIFGNLYASCCKE